MANLEIVAVQSELIQRDSLKKSVITVRVVREEEPGAGERADSQTFPPKSS